MTPASSWAAAAVSIKGMKGDYNGRLGESGRPILFPGQQPADRESAALTVLTIVLIRDAGLTTDFRRHNLVTRRQQLPCPRGRARLDLAKLAYSDTFIDRLSETVLDVGNTTLDSAALCSATTDCDNFLLFQGTFSLIIEAYHENHIVGK